MSKLVQLIPLSQPWNLQITFFKRDNMEHITSVEIYPLIAWGLTDDGLVRGVYASECLVGWVHQDDSWPAPNDDDVFDFKYVQAEHL